MESDRKKRAFLRTVGLLLVVGASVPAAAYQRKHSAHGSPLHWPSAALTVALDKASQGALVGGQEALKGALALWQVTACNGPNLSVGRPERANIVVRFVSHDWNYGQTIAAYTEVDSDPDRGTIRNASIWLNGAYSFAASVPPARPAGENPQAGPLHLETILAHELGHALGLGHSHYSDALMAAGFSSKKRAPPHLSPDDVSGVCAIFRPRPARKVTSHSLTPSTNAHFQAPKPPAASKSAVWVGLLLVALVPWLFFRCIVFLRRLRKKDQRSME